MEDKVGLKAKALQNQETLQLRKNDSEKLDELVLRNQRYIKMTEEVTKTIKELQVSAQMNILSVTSM